MSFSYEWSRRLPDMKGSWKYTEQAISQTDDKEAILG
jgi:hypothetical protein